MAVSARRRGRPVPGMGWLFAGLIAAVLAGTGFGLLQVRDVLAPGGGSAPPVPAASPSPTPSPSASPSPSPLPSPRPAASPSTRPSPRPVPPPVPPAGAGHRILIDLSRQHLWAYDGSRLFLDTVVATGRPELPTVQGTFHILVKYSPYQFVSPWPYGSPYWYAPAWSQYAMEFESSGFFIHDAPWRTVWGPGADQIAGSHGCVNVPTTPMTKLYAWARVGDLVIVQP